jgi:hypothetical protein
VLDGEPLWPETVGLPLVPVGAGPSLVMMEVTTIGVRVSPGRVAEGVIVTIDVAISVVGAADGAVTVEV